jgi:hypothetical protein
MKLDRVRRVLLPVCAVAAAGFAFRDLMATIQIPEAVVATGGAHRDGARTRPVALHREGAPHAPAAASHAASAAGARPAMTPRERLAALRTPLSLESANNPFAASSWLPPPPPPVEVAPAPPAPAPPPTAPPVPFTYLGELNAKAAKPQVFLSSGDRLLIVSPGEVVDGQYRVDSISETDVVLTYLPLNQRQSISTQSEGK